jgi:hypothetical protein
MLPSTAYTYLRHFVVTINVSLLFDDLAVRLRGGLFPVTIVVTTFGFLADFLSNHRNENIGSRCAHFVSRKPHYYVVDVHNMLARHFHDVWLANVLSWQTKKSNQYIMCPECHIKVLRVALYLGDFDMNLLVLRLLFGVALLL